MKELVLDDFAGRYCQVCSQLQPLNLKFECTQRYSTYNVMEKEGVSHEKF